jgi:protein-S-isoprenylcysteine O-methyltransferase Ste14
MIVYKIVYWLGLVVEVVIRAPYRKSWKQAEKTERLHSRVDQVLLVLMSVAGLAIPLIYSVTNWLAFADYRLPAWLGWSGAAVMTGAVFVFFQAHRDLKANWSPILEIFTGHALVTKGIYSVIRHPMYASGWLLAVAQILLLQNWIAGPITLIVYIPLYIIRVPSEERLMLDTFGEQYRDYCKKTGAVIPRFK